MSHVDLSFVMPVYFNEGSLWASTRGLLDEVVARHPELRFEFVFVDDGSRDGSLAELRAIQAEYPELVTIVALTRNFGQPAARLAGLRQARGELIVSMSADGQDPPGLVNDMIAAHRDQGHEIVACMRQGRDESAFRVWTSRVFYVAMRWLSFPNMPDGGFDYVLLTRRVLEYVLSLDDATPFFQGQLLWSGYATHFIPYHRLARRVGRSRWTFGKKLTLLMDAVLGYSFFPIRMIAVFGVVSAVLGFITAAALVFRYVVLGSEVEGWTTIVALMLLTSGAQLLMLGVLGEYQWRALAQVRIRPMYLVREVSLAKETA